MIKKYRKKPVVAEARRLNSKNFMAVYKWIKNNIKSTWHRPVDYDLKEGWIEIHNEEKDCRAYMGNWIIHEVYEDEFDQFIIRSHSVFQATYEEVKDEVNRDN